MKTYNKGTLRERFWARVKITGAILAGRDPLQLTVSGPTPEPRRPRQR